MPNSSITDIKTAFVNVLATITVTNGYSKDFDITHIYPDYDQKTAAQQDDALYPKYFILLDAGSNELLPAGRVFAKISFSFVAIVKKLLDSDSSPSIQIEALVGDIDRALMKNSTLQGKVEDAKMSEYNTDSGSLYPEGASVMKIEVEYFKQW